MVLKLYLTHNGLIRCTGTAVVVAADAQTELRNRTHSVVDDSVTGTTLLDCVRPIDDPNSRSVQIPNSLEVYDDCAFSWFYSRAELRP